MADERFTKTAKTKQTGKTHHCPMASKGNCVPSRKKGDKFCTKHQHRCPTCNLVKIISEVCVKCEMARQCEEARRARELERENKKVEKASKKKNDRNFKVEPPKPKVLWKPSFKLLRRKQNESPEKEEEEKDPSATPD